MKGYAFALALAGFSVAAVSLTGDSHSLQTGTYTGTIHDQAAQITAEATQCPVIKGPRYTLQAGDAAWVLPDEQLVAKYAGRRVTVRANVIDGNKLKIIGIMPAK